jgi:hypothetical protein
MMALSAWGTFYPAKYHTRGEYYFFYTLGEINKSRIMKTEGFKTSKFDELCGYISFVCARYEKDNMKLVFISHSSHFETDNTEGPRTMFSVILIFK